MTDPRFDSLTTPCLLLDEARMLRNIARLNDHAARLNVPLRPHLKTAKCLEVAHRALAGGTGPATVSTLAEAEVFARAGLRDILYAVGIAPAKLGRVLDLHRAGCRVSVLLDSVAQARAVAEASRLAGIAIPALIEIDSDGHRAGLAPDDPALIDIGRHLHAGGAALDGVLCHAGQSYGAVGTEAQADFAEVERLAATRAADTLRMAGLPCPVVSVGSTPTAHAARDLAGVTELRAGNYMFFDLVMAGIDVCRADDIALSVLTTVIGHQSGRGRVMIDAGWMALSRDRGTASQRVDQGYGVVCDAAGRVLPDLIVAETSQEHGMIAMRGGTGTLPDLPVGTQLRILPNHACATAAQHAQYHVITPEADAPLGLWPRFGGW